MTQPRSNAPLHLVLGAGQIGPLVAERLLARGYRVRLARRTAAPSRVAGIENIALDVRDADAVARAAEGAAVVYHCVNPLYHQWHDLLLPMTRGIVDGTARAGASLVVLDNLYMYGDTRLMNERTEERPVSRKGALRVEAARVMLEADARGALRVAIGRAADFFGPRASLGAMFGDRFYKRVLAGQSAQCFGDPDMLHSYSYTPDVASGLVALGERIAANAANSVEAPDSARGVWMLPVQPAESTRAVVDRFARSFGRPIETSSVPTWMLSAAGVFLPLLREVAEMTYQWKQPYVVDDAKFRAVFGFGPTAWDEAIAATAEWARSEFGDRRALSPAMQAG